MAAERVKDPIPAPVKEILDLFDGPLADLAFPDVDAGTLEGLADGVRARAREVEEARQRLDAARAALDEAQGALSRAARKGLAYAQVFAEGDEALAARLEALSLARTEPGPARGRKARRKRAPAAEAAPPPERPNGVTVELPLAAGLQVGAA